MVYSSVGSARPGKHGWLEWHALPVRRREIVLNCLLRSLSVGDHGGTFPLSWWVWCLHGNQIPLFWVCMCVFVWGFNCKLCVMFCLIRIWSTGGFQWTWCWRWLPVSATDSSFSSRRRAWGICLYTVYTLVHQHTYSQFPPQRLPKWMTAIKTSQWQSNIGHQRTAHDVFTCSLHEWFYSRLLGTHH